MKLSKKMHPGFSIVIVHGVKNTVKREKGPKKVRARIASNTVALPA